MDEYRDIVLSDISQTEIKTLYDLTYIWDFFKQDKHKEKE
jgi:hypothetical protein